MSSSKIHLGIIGLGGIGKRHLANFARLSDEVEIVALCDKDPQALASVQQKAPKMTTNVEEFFGVPLDAVCVCTPNASHYELVKRALLKGLHVLCEKPFTLKVQEARELSELAEKHNLVGMIAFSYRFVPAFRMLREIVQRGKAGRLYHIRCHYLQSWLSSPRAPFSWRLDSSQAGTGVLGDLGAHVFDMGEFLTGKKLARVYAFARTFIPSRYDPASGGYREVDVDDAVVVLGEMEDGTFFTAEMSRYATGRGNSFTVEINGDRGAFIADVERPGEILACPEAMAEYTDFTTNFASFPCPSSFGETDHYYSQTKAFVQTVKGHKADFLPSFFDGWRCQEIIESCSLSIQKGRWVEVKPRTAG